MKKLFLFLIMVACTVGMQAKTDKFACNVTLSASGNASYSEGTFSWTASYSNSMQIFKGLKSSNVDLANYKYLVVKTSDKTGSYRILIYCNNNGSTTSFIGTYSDDEIKIDLTTLALTTQGDTYANINNIYIAGSGASGSLKVTAKDIYLETAEYENMTIKTTIDKNSTKDTPFNWTQPSSSTQTMSAVNNNMGKATSGGDSKYFGRNSYLTQDYGYFDLTGYDHVKATLGADYNTEKSAEINFINQYGSKYSTNLTFTNSQKSGDIQEADINFTVCTSIKSGGNTQNVSSIVFSKDFAATSTTEFDIAASTSSTVNYDREFIVDKISTVCLPFALNAAQVTSAGDFYELAKVDDSGLHFNKVETTEAYKPYLFKAAQTTPFAGLTGIAIAATKKNNYTVGDYTFQGTLNYTNNAASLGTKVYGWSTNGEFVKVGTGVSCNAFRAVVTTSSTAKVSLGAFFDDSTGIEEVSNEQLTINNEQSANANAKANAIYNLNGIRVNGNYKGIVIVNGKKIVKLGLRL